MKISHLLAILSIGICLTLIACDNKKSDPATTEENTTVSPGETVSQDPTIITLETGSETTSATSGGTEQHYKCPTAGCTGGAGSQGKCPVCGADLVHNQAFHAQSATTPGSTPVNPVMVDPNSKAAPANATPPSAQNAKGVYHYTCTKGCEGGAASAGNCAKCGAPLAHNQEFHN